MVILLSYLTVAVSCPLPAHVKDVSYGGYLLCAMYRRLTERMITWRIHVANRQNDYNQRLPNVPVFQFLFQYIRVSLDDRSELFLQHFLPEHKQFFGLSFGNDPVGQRYKIDITPAGPKVIQN